MQTKLKEKFWAYIINYHPDLMFKLQEDYRVTQYLEDAVAAVMPKVSTWLTEGKPAYIVEELALKELTATLGPSRFSYLKDVLETEFADTYHQFAEAGVLTYECVNLVEHCAAVFEELQFSEANAEDRYLRYAIIAAVHEYIN